MAAKFLSHETAYTCCYQGTIDHYQQLVVVVLCGVKFGKYLNFAYFPFSQLHLYIGVPPGDHVCHVVIRAWILFPTSAKKMVVTLTHSVPSGHKQCVLP